MSRDSRPLRDESRDALEEVLANCRDSSAKCRFCGCGDTPHFSVCPVPKVQTALKNATADGLRKQMNQSEDVARTLACEIGLHSVSSMSAERGLVWSRSELESAIAAAYAPLHEQRDELVRVLTSLLACTTDAQLSDAMVEAEAALEKVRKPK